MNAIFIFPFSKNIFKLSSTYFASLFSMVLFAFVLVSVFEDRNSDLWRSRITNQTMASKCLSEALGSKNERLVN